MFQKVSNSGDICSHVCVTDALVFGCSIDCFVLCCLFPQPVHFLWWKERILHRGRTGSALLETLSYVNQMWALQAGQAPQVSSSFYSVTMTRYLMLQQRNAQHWVIWGGIFRKKQLYKMYQLHSISFFHFLWEEILSFQKSQGTLCFNAVLVYSVQILGTSVVLQVVEIASLTEHLLTECDKKDSFGKCQRCSEAFPKDELPKHVKSRTCNGE